MIAENTVSGEVIDIYDAAGLPKPQLGDLTPEYQEKAQQADNAHLAIEALRPWCSRSRRGLSATTWPANGRSPSGLAELMNRYTHSQLTAAEVIAELVAMVKEVSAEAKRGEKFEPPLSTDELAYFDAVATNESAVLEMGDDVLAAIARELVAIMRRDVRTDWTVREDVRAKLRSSIKRLLIRYNFLPDKQAGAVKLVLEQMEQMAPRYARSHDHDAKAV